jgi:hypothetical protein
MELLKRSDSSLDLHIVWTPRDDDADDGFERIRCPLCAWRPAPGSTWCCVAQGTPEPPFEWCGTSWNTFTTRGRCPGCAHQWQWTSCLRCGGFSLHEDWYECGR